MPTRAQRRSNQAVRGAVEHPTAYKAELPEGAEQQFGMRREFAAEAILGTGLVSLTIRPHS